MLKKTVNTISLRQSTHWDRKQKRAHSDMWLWWKISREAQSLSDCYPGQDNFLPVLCQREYLFLILWRAQSTQGRSSLTVWTKTSKDNFPLVCPENTSFLPRVLHSTSGHRKGEDWRARDTSAAEVCVWCFVNVRTLATSPQNSDFWQALSLVLVCPTNASGIQTHMHLIPLSLKSTRVLNWAPTLTGPGGVTKTHPIGEMGQGYTI